MSMGRKGGRPYRFEAKRPRIIAVMLGLRFEFVISRGCLREGVDRTKAACPGRRRRA